MSDFSQLLELVKQNLKNQDVQDEALNKTLLELHDALKNNAFPKAKLLTQRLIAMSQVKATYREEQTELVNQLEAHANVWDHFSGTANQYWDLDDEGDLHGDY